MTTKENITIKQSVTDMCVVIDIHENNTFIFWTKIFPEEMLGLLDWLVHDMNDTWENSTFTLSRKNSSSILFYRENKNVCITYVPEIAPVRLSRAFTYDLISKIAEKLSILEEMKLNDRSTR